jgi:hypothetical protein
VSFTPVAFQNNYIFQVNIGTLELDPHKVTLTSYKATAAPKGSMWNWTSHILSMTGAQHHTQPLVDMRSYELFARNGLNPNPLNLCLSRS